MPKKQPRQRPEADVLHAPNRPERKSEENPSLSFRVPSEAMEAIDDLRPLFPTVDGSRAKRSDVLRAMVLRVMGAAARIAAARKIDAELAWRLVFAALDRLVTQAPAERDQEGNQEGETSP